MSQGTKLNVQLINEGEGKWPYVGRAVVNKNRTINLYLDPNKTVPTGARLYLSEARTKDEAQAQAQAE